ncbi:MAG: photosystem reaction center protein H [Epulopiscium sp. Nele67-Bin004]|nr:MAG: photosystem reaction center protein H [Epulopiscium sp. Nele67-Bin004]OON99888.1 MAG: photosystem reaction center protein H [Epulopiscium sp. Nele67-Bin004]
MRISDMKHKEIINILDGSRLGYICDVEIDWTEGKVKTLIVPGPGKIMGMFGRELEYIIPWDNIKKIGEDTILVELCGQEI